MSDRGSGRTSRQLAALPDGSFYLVPNRPHASHCERLLLDMGRPRTSIRFVTAQDTCAMLGVRPVEWDVDHAYFEVTGRRGLEAFDFLGMAAGKGPLSER